jgi:hypothetical protein
MKQYNVFMDADALDSACSTESGLFSGHHVNALFENVFGAGVVNELGTAAICIGNNHGVGRAGMSSLDTDEVSGHLYAIPREYVTAAMESLEIADVNDLYTMSATLFDYPEHHAVTLYLNAINNELGLDKENSMTRSHSWTDEYFITELSLSPVRSTAMH